jgi:hypothetical protein
MPSKTQPQASLMAGVAHNPVFAAKVGIPQSVGRDFSQADKGTGILKKKKPFGAFRVRIGSKSYE